MKGKFAFIFIALVTLPGLGQASCFRTHVLEGRELNRERRSAYVDWAREHDLAARARLVSHALTALETSMLPMARWYDHRTRDYVETGLFCDDFIPISETPEFSRDYAQIPNGSYVSKLAFLKLYEKEMRENLKAARWDRLRLLSLKAIEQFHHGQTHCLTRHFVESIGRISALAPRHIRRAQERGLESPRTYIDSIIRYHLFGLDYALKIDALASPLQYVGIPIVCRDVPFIPIPALTR